MVSLLCFGVLNRTRHTIAKEKASKRVIGTGAISFVGSATRCGWPDSARLGFGGEFNKGVI
jgi:hypothetical protein